MGFAVSPAVTINEFDLTNIVPSVATTEGAIVGVFNTGPINQRILIDSEKTLAQRFGKPDANNFETWFTAANFLAYSNKLYVTRVVPSDAVNAADDANTGLIANRTEAEALSSASIVAKSPGALGNSLRVSVCSSATEYNEAITLVGSMSAGDTTVDIVDTEVTNKNLAVNDIIRVGNTTIGYQDMIVSSIGAADANNNQLVTFTGRYKLSGSSPASAQRYWRYYNNVEGAPAGSNSHIVVVDEDGLVTGTNNTILEVWENVSSSSTAKNDIGESVYVNDVLDEKSNYIWAGGNSISAAGLYASLAGGSNGTGGTESTIALSRLALGIDLYSDDSAVDISLFLAGKATSTVATYIIDNVAEARKDCMVFVSPERSDVVEQATGTELDQIIAFRNALPSTSYAVMDSGYKYQYDKYNGVYRWVPLNGDMAGLCARTDNIRDPWVSPAGYNRGSIKNIFNLAFNPTKAQRDILYKSNVNPVITQPGQGFILFGDKTLLSTPSAFDRINVRRLFIVLEKAIATAAKYILFELNNDITRARFKNLVEPFLRDVQGRQGVTDFRFVCNETNNTPQVIDRNELVGDVYVVPSRSINNVTLNFVATRTGVEFEEIVGRF